MECSVYCVVSLHMCVCLCICVLYWWIKSDAFVFPQCQCYQSLVPWPWSLLLLYSPHNESVLFYLGNVIGLDLVIWLQISQLKADVGVWGQKFRNRATLCYRRLEGNKICRDWGWNGDWHASIKKKGKSSDMAGEDKWVWKKTVREGERLELGTERENLLSEASLPSLLLASTTPSFKLWTPSSWSL